MSGAIPPLPPYASTAWCSVKAQGQLYLYLYILHRLRVFENRVLRIFGPKREEDGSWRKIHNDELHGLYSSPNIVKVIKSRRMRWAGHVAC
jgi:hypothetical protein